MIILIITSGFEFPYFFSWVITGGTQSTNIIKPIADLISGSPAIPGNGNNYRISEFKAYGINNNLDILTKGRLQGFFQPEFYGLVFWAFLLVIIIRFQNKIKNPLSKLILLFIGLYYLIFIDVLGINSNQYAYVTTVSHKYTAVLIPFISVIIASEWQWIKNKFRFITFNRFLILSLIVFLTAILFIKSHVADVFQIIRYFMPVTNSPDYYLGKISVINNIVAITSFVTLLLLLILAIFFNQNSKRFWGRLKPGALVVVVFIFFAPSLFFFETTFGLVDTIKYPFASDETKLSKIKGWSALYTLVNSLNRLPRGSKFLMVNAPYQLMAIHLDIPSRDIIFLNDNEAHIVNNAEIYSTVINIRPDYVLMPTDSSIIPDKFLLKSSYNMSLYKSGLSE